MRYHPHHHAAGRIWWTLHNCRMLPPPHALIQRYCCACHTCFSWRLNPKVFCRYGCLSVRSSEPTFNAWGCYGEISILNFDVKRDWPLGREIFPDAKVMRAWTGKYRCTIPAQKIRQLSFFFFLRHKKEVFQIFSLELLAPYVHFLSHSFRIVKSPHPEDITRSFTFKISSKWKIQSPHQPFKHWR